MHHKESASPLTWFIEHTKHREVHASSLGYVSSPACVGPDSCRKSRIFSEQTVPWQLVLITARSHLCNVISIMYVCKYWANTQMIRDTVSISGWWDHRWFMFFYALSLSLSLLNKYACLKWIVVWNPGISEITILRSGCVQKSVSHKETLNGRDGWNIVYAAATGHGCCWQKCCQNKNQFTKKEICSWDIQLLSHFN